MRKFTATHVAKEGATETIRTVATHMTHSEDTARRYYQHLQGADESVEAFSVMSRKHPPTEEEDLPIVPRLKKARQKWNGPEEDTLKEHFSLEPGGKAPSLEQCSTFLGLLSDMDMFTTRTNKEIQDKCRTILRQLQKLDQQ